PTRSCDTEAHLLRSPALALPSGLNPSPTRRSSDLHAGNVPHPRWRVKPYHVVHVRARTNRASQRGRLRLLAKLDSCVRVLGPHGDRKSTRLNSSHSQISYAVFCLKKKKKKNLKQKY